MELSKVCLLQDVKQSGFETLLLMALANFCELICLRPEMASPK
jgi:hypothetical protein